MQSSKIESSISSRELGDSTLNNESGYNSSCQSEPFTSDGSVNYSIDSIINSYGYGWEVWKILLSVFFCFLINGYLTTSLSSYILPYRDKFQLTESQISMLGTAFFITKFISSCTIGYQTHFLSRIIIIKISIFVTFFLVALNAIIISYGVVMVFQILGGFASGIFEITSFNIACEFTPTKYRGWVMISIWNGYNVGVLFPNLIMLVTMPNYEKEKLRITLIFTAVVIFVFGGFSLFFLKDSPRNLVLSAKFRDAFKILKKMIDFKLTKKMKKEIIKEILLKKSEEAINRRRKIDIRRPHIPKEEMVGVKDVFAKGMFWTGILLVLICFFGNCIIDGFQLVLNLILDGIYNDQSKNKILIDNILINSICLPSNFFLGIFTEFKFLGRKYTQLFGFLILGSFIVPVMFDIGHAYIYLIFFMFFTCITNMVNVYVAEIYPTKTRDMALGVIQAFGYFGSCISQFLFVFLNEMGFNAGPITFCSFCVLNAILSLFLKVDTYQRPLDSGEEDENENYKNMIEKLDEIKPEEGVHKINS